MTKSERNPKSEVPRTEEIPRYVAGVTNRRIIWIFLFCSLVSFTCRAHVGSPTVFFEGQAGPYNTHVVIRPAEVIPGLAEIAVRVDGTKAERVTALPIKWNAGRQGAPPPDVAKPVAGETNLYR